MTSDEIQPVAWCYLPDMEWLNATQITSRSIPVWSKPVDHYNTPLYLHQPRPAVRLSDVDILPLINREIEDYMDGGYAKSSYMKSNLQDFARAIEAAVLKKNNLEVKDE